MKYSFSLYFQLTVIFVLLSIFSVLGAGSLNYFEGRRIIIAQFNKSMLDTAEIIGLSLNDRADDAAEAIMRLSRHQTLSSADYEELRRFLQIAVDSSSLFNNIYYFSPEGPLRAAAYADGRDVARYADENFFNYADQEKTHGVYLDLVRALTTCTPVFSSFFKSYTGILMNSFIVPVTDDQGEVMGLLSCGIVLDRSFKLLELMQTLRPHTDGYLALIDTKGNILLSAGKMPAELSPGPGWSGREERLHSAAGYLQAVVSLEKTGLGICCGVPETAVSELLQRLRRANFKFTILTGVVASLAGLILAWLLVSPLAALVRGLGAMSRGEEAPRLSCRASGEIAEAIRIYHELREKPPHS